MLKKMRVSALTFIILLFSAMGFVAKASEVVSLCNACSPSQIEKIALKSQTYGGRVHVVDFTTGQVKSFDVEHDFEPGFEFHYAIPVTTSNEAFTAARAVNSLINDAIADGGIYDRQSNTLTQTVSIPSSIALTSKDVRNYEISQAVSQHLREKLIRDFWQKFSAAWQKVIEKIVFKVKTKFADGSSAIYALGPIFFSDHPFVLERASVKDKDGNPISTDGFGSSGSGEDINYGDVYASNGLHGLALQCRSYTISSSDGSSWSGFNCWYIGSP